MERIDQREWVDLTAVAPSFEELAAQQGIKPIDDFDSLLGHPSDEDETAEEFAAMLREWRTEGPRECDR